MRHAPPWPAALAAAVTASISLALPPAIPTPVPGPPLAAHPLATASPPTIDGQVGVGEWPYAPQIVIDSSYPTSYVRPTYATFANDSTTLYVLVDAPGDETDDSQCDECMMIFAPKAGSPVQVSIYLVLGNPAEVKPAGVVAAIGFGPSPNSLTDHRIYEFAMPLSVLGASAGEPLDFCSPAFFKTCGALPGIAGSMPYDGSTGNDNIWPPGPAFDYATRETWSTFGLAQLSPVPALDRAGRGAFALLLALGGLLVLFHRRA
jgi:hypothetical protein